MIKRKAKEPTKIVLKSGVTILIPAEALPVRLKIAGVGGGCGLGPIAGGNKLS